MVEWLKIVGLAIAAAVLYGVLHDQVTLRICLEYFTVGHPPIFAHLPDTLHAAAWGVVATWWMGLLLGIPAATCSRVGRWPKLSVGNVAPLVARLLLVMAIGSLVAGLVGWIAATNGLVYLREPFASSVPQESHVRFIIDIWAHLAAYAFGFFGGLTVCAIVVRRRHRAALIKLT